MTDKNQSSQGNTRTFYEEISVAGNQLVERLEAMIKQGNIRRLIIKDQGGKIMLEMPLTLGVVAGTGIAMLAFPLAVLGAVAAVVTRVQVIVERYEDPADAEKEKAAEVEVSKN